MARWSGWLAALAVVVASLVPIVHRLRAGRRAELRSPSVSRHVSLGLGAAALGALHPLTAVLALGGASAIGAGNLGLAFGALTFLVLLAHTGLGLRLRDPKLRERPRIRRQHVITAVTITLATAAHVAACRLGG